MDKKSARARRARKTRAKIRELGVHRLAVHRTPRHMYAQVISPDGATVLASASTVEAEVRGALKSTGNIDAAKKVGELVGERAVAAGISSVAFDRSGFLFHGRIKALADGAREKGLQF
ncbi:MAG: 50S ribosomal protein L18 [Chromatiales bacterium]|nr:50S ribosomal protein L18 [Gammaproteobacteria bacterium]MCP5352000.1 50S ribosomal protein L18 [Chromatiales bacterium]